MLESNESVSAYIDLTYAVGAIDQKAAQYLTFVAPKLKSFDYNKHISACFLWEETEQGYEYWNNIYNKLASKYQ